MTFISKSEHEQADAAAITGATLPPADGNAGGGAIRAGVEEAIEAIRPALQMDGGDVTLVGVDEATGVVEIELIGACVGCPASTMTLKAGIERILKDRVDGITEVNAVGLEPAFEY
ncbi:MAG: NifU family protein [Acidimicrobiales bacterium]